MFGVTQPNTVADLSPPFWYLERDTTTHAPYIEDAFVHGTDVESYFDERGSDWRRIKQDYQQTIRDSFELLEKRLRILDRLDILDDTLVVFTADHGELFGEYGNVLHVAPVCPELVYVPTVFIHPSLTADSFAVNPASEVIEHVDVITTCLEAIGRGDAVSTEGSNIFETRRNHEFGYNHVHVERGDRVFYSTGSIWWSDGGYADFDNPRALRAAFFLYHLLRNPARATLRENLPESAIPFLESHRRFGRTPITDSEANQLLNEVESSFTVAESDSMTMDDEMREKLQNLGYLN
jgi:arylsulfatase A-like enzyme